MGIDVGRGARAVIALAVPRWVIGLFLEALVMALADVVAELIGWLARRAWKRRKKKRKDEENE